MIEDIIRDKYGKIMRGCSICGELCYGRRCSKCFSKNKRGSVGRSKSRKLGE